MLSGVLWQFSCFSFLGGILGLVWGAVIFGCFGLVVISLGVY